MNVAVLGTGLLGFPVAAKMLDAGHKLVVYNRTQTKADGLKTKGAAVTADPIEAIAGGECVFILLSDYSAIAEVLFSDSRVSFDGKTVFQMGTIAPAQSIALQEKISGLGGAYLECPVLGSKKEAAAGTLIVMVGGTREKYDKWKTFLSVLGQNPRYAGEVGCASALKLALNQLIAAHICSFSLSLGMVQKNQVDTGLFMDILRESSLYAPMFDKKLNNLLKQSYDNPNFSARHLLKDVELVLQEAQDKDLALCFLEGIKEILNETLQRGLGDKDYSSAFQTITNA